MRAAAVLLLVVCVLASQQPTRGSTVGLAKHRKQMAKALDEALAPVEGGCASYAVQGEKWRYRWCHKRAVMQSDGNNEAVVGRYSAERSRDSGGAHVFADGAPCEPNGTKPMRAHVHFQCCEPRNVSARAHNLLSHEARNLWIESVREGPSTCEYELAVCAQVVCGNRNSTLYRTMRQRRRHLEKRGEMPEAERRRHREIMRNMFIKGYDAYMKHAYPDGELMPLTCSGRNFHLSKIPALTLIDSLDTLAIMGNKSEFKNAVGLVSGLFKKNGFNLDVNVSLFETTIRVLGGLLAAHLLAVDPALGLLDDYDGFLLVLAQDLGTRLLPAFETSTGIPYGTVNLAHGVPKGETVVSSLAGSGSLSLEFSVLSALTGVAEFGEVAVAAAKALFDRRSTQLGLLGKHVNTRSGKWVESLSGIGSNSDSYYEYLLKMYLLFGYEEFWVLFLESYGPILQHSRRGDWYADVDMFGGSARHRRDVFEGLQAFWPGLQALAGDTRLAARSLNAFYVAWNDWGALPEEFDFGNMKLLSTRDSAMRYPLRPELIESTYVLRRISGDDSWLWAASDFARAIFTHNPAECGYASLQNSATSQLDDEMPSYFLAETTKYLYLLFDDDNFINHGDFVFSTEAHPFHVDTIRRLQRVKVQEELTEKQPEKYWLKVWRNVMTTMMMAPDDDDAPGVKKQKRRVYASESLVCLPRMWYDSFGYSRSFEDSILNDEAGQSVLVSTTNRCLPGETSVTEAPATVVAPAGGSRLDVPGIGTFEVELFADGFRVANILTDESLEMTNIGSPIALLTATYGEDSEVPQNVMIGADTREIVCRLTVPSLPPLECSVASFGRTSTFASSGSAESSFAVEAALVVPVDPEGCDEEAGAGMRFVRRGRCTFESKALLAHAGGARVLVVANTVPGQARFIMANSTEETNAQQEEIATVMISREDGALLRRAKKQTAVLTIKKRQLGPQDPVSVHRVSEGIFRVFLGPKSAWGVQLAFIADTPDWQLFIFRKDMLPAPRCSSAEFFTATATAHFDDASMSRPLATLEDLTLLLRCQCPASVQGPPFVDEESVFAAYVAFLGTLTGAYLMTTPIPSSRSSRFTLVVLATLTAILAANAAPFWAAAVQQQRR